MQSPRDGWAFYSVVATAGPGNRSQFFDSQNSASYDLSPFKSIFVHSELHSELPESSSGLSHIFPEWETTDIPMIYLPLIFLAYQVKQSSGKLANLILQVEQVESIVSSRTHTANLNDLIHTLHSCNTNLIKLERRWNFQEQVASSIQGLLDTYKDPTKRPKVYERRLNKQYEWHILYAQGNFTTGIQFVRLESEVILQSKMSRALEYDINVLQRRISDQFTAVGPLLGYYAYKCH